MQVPPTMMSPMRAMLLLLVACGGAPATGTVASPPADPAPCADVAYHELEVMNLAFLGAQKTGQMRVQIQARCRDDSWPLAARRCILTATSFDDMTACHDKLSASQRTALQHEISGSDEPIPDQTPPPPPELLK
jgi:hypothetical protein